MPEGENGPATEGAEEGAAIEFTGDFDPDRAKAALAKSRAAEKAAKQKLAEQAERLAAYEKAEAEKAEAEKRVEDKLAEAEAKIADLQRKDDLRKVRDDFMVKAAARGYADPSLAFIAAEAQGALGELAKDGETVGNHDFDALEASHATFAAEAGANGKQATGDAAAKTGASPKTAAERFNAEIRAQF